MLQTRTPTPTIAILGATGKVGLATARHLCTANILSPLRIRAIVRDPNAPAAARLRALGCEISVLPDLHSPSALATALAGAEYVQIVLPPDPTHPDPAGRLREGVSAIVEALRTVGGEGRLRGVLVVSDYGAHVKAGRDVGMPSLFREFEGRLREVQVESRNGEDGGIGNGNVGGKKGWEMVVVRSAEQIENYGRVVPVVRDTGVLPSFIGAEGRVPMVAGEDVGRVAGEIWGELMEREEEFLRWGDEEGEGKGESGKVRVMHVEGPERYSPREVAEIMGELLGREVGVGVIPREGWEEAFEKAGVKKSMAELLIKANEAVDEGGLVDVEMGGELRYGRIGLADALRPVVLGEGEG